MQDGKYGQNTEKFRVTTSFDWWISYIKMQVHNKMSSFCYNSINYYANEHVYLKAQILS